MITAQQAQNVLDYLREHQRMTNLSDEELCREILTVAPVFGRLGELIEILCERVCPGLIEKMDSEEKEVDSACNDKHNSDSHTPTPSPTSPRDMGNGRV